MCPRDNTVFYSDRCKKYGRTSSLARRLAAARIAGKCAYIIILTEKASLVLCCLPHC
jgi:hypothetical protein